MRFDTAARAVEAAIANLRFDGQKVDTGHWQGVATEGKPDLVTREIINLQLEFPIPPSADEALIQLHPNMPWAENHFQERVGREPTNPGHEYQNWPWWRGQVKLTDAKMKPTYEGDKQLTSFKFTHTYQERFWPKEAGKGEDSLCRRCGARSMPGYHKNYGIRYAYGDLDDVVGLLRREPHTRQAYFPIFFPEDTGAVHHGRIPCTLGYHFLLRDGKLHLWYHIRSCDAVRHFRDDLYMACRLVHWVLDELREEPEVQGQYDLWRDVEPGLFHFTAYSFHVHMGDYHLL